MDPGRYAHGLDRNGGLAQQSPQGVVDALDTHRRHFPFPIRGIDSDNGSEFIHYHLVAWCDTHHITFTRSRAYHKNDGCDVEQKNWTVVRRFVGYLRYEGSAVKPPIIRQASIVHDMSSRYVLMGEITRLLDCYGRRGASSAHGARIPPGGRASRVRRAAASQRSGPPPPGQLRPPRAERWTRVGRCVP